MLTLVATFGHVDVKREFEIGGQGRPRADHVRAGGVDRVRGRLSECHPIAAQRTGQLPEVPLSDPGCFLESLGSAGPVVHRARQHQTDAHLLRGIHHGQIVLVPAVVQVEEVDGRGDAGPGHLGEVEQRPGLDGFPVEPF